MECRYGAMFVPFIIRHRPIGSIQLRPPSKSQAKICMLIVARIKTCLLIAYLSQAKFVPVKRSKTSHSPSYAASMALRVPVQRLFSSQTDQCLVTCTRYLTHIYVLAVSLLIQHKSLRYITIPPWWNPGIWQHAPLPLLSNTTAVASD